MQPYTPAHGRDTADLSVRRARPSTLSLAPPDEERCRNLDELTLEAGRGAPGPLGVAVRLDRDDHADAVALGHELDDHVVFVGLDAGEEVDHVAQLEPAHRFDLHYDGDGDGVCDLFRTTGSHWCVAYGTAGRGTAHGTWQYVATWSGALSSLHAGDFDGDGTTDLFRFGSDGWNLSTGQRDRRMSTWRVINDLPTGTSLVVFGDFDGDGSADLLSGQPE